MNRNIFGWLPVNRDSFTFRMFQASLIAFVLGINGLAISAILLAFLGWVLDRNILWKLTQTVRNPLFWVLSSYFFITLAGILNSEDVTQGWKYAEMRLLILMVPLLLVTGQLTRKMVDDLLLTWVIVIIAAFVLGISNSLFLYLDTGDTGYFYNDNLIAAVRKQAPYFGLYVNFSLAICFYFFLNNSRIQRGMLIGFITVLVICQFLLAVRIALLTMCLLGFGLILFIAFKRGPAKGLVVLLTLVGVLVASWFIFPQTMNRFKSLTSNLSYSFDNPNPVNHFNAPVNSENWNGLTIRLALWECGWNIIRQHPILGVGTGDYDDAMNTQFEKKNFIYARKMNFGVHNQYLYSWISFGISGLIVVAGILILPLILSPHRKNPLLMTLVLILAIAFLTENVLNRFYGIYFFAVFMSLLVIQPHSESDHSALSES